MNKQRKTSNILNVFRYDAEGHVVLPASVTVSIAPGAGDNNSKVPTTAWVRTYVTGLTYLTGNQSITVSGDATGSGTTSINLTLANTAVTPGIYGSATLVPVVTVDSKGRITSVSTASISGALTFTGDVTGTGTTGTSTALTLANSGVTAGTFTKVTVDSKGRVTVGASATTSDIAEGTRLYYTDARVLAYLGANNYATQSYVTTQINNLVAGAPGLLDTLDELAAALGDDANFATTTATSLGNRLRVDTAAQGLNSTQQGNGRTNLGLGTAALSATGDFATAAQGTRADTAHGWGNHASAGYLTSATAATTYLSQTTASNTYLTLTNAASTYLSQTSAGNTYLTLTNAASTYLSQTSASNTYLTLTNAASTYLSQSSASSNYLTLTNAASTYLTQSSASSSYVSLSGSYANPSWITSLAYSKITGVPAFLTSYTEVDTLASVTARGASTSTAVTFSTNATIGRVLIDFDGTDTWFRMQSGNRMRVTTTGGTDFIIPNTGNMTYNGNTVWHSGNLTNLNQLTNSPGYITTARDWFGAMTTSGTADWNHVTNTRPGTGYTLLLGTHSNGPGPGEYFHPFNLEYSSKDGTGNVTQMAISYGSPGNKIYIRGRYDGSWNGWNQVVTNSGTWGISITGNAATLGGYGPNQTGGAYTIVQRDANGYIQNSYFYMSGGGSERNSSGLGYIAGFNSSDYYVRSYNSTAVASFLGLGSMAYASTGSYLSLSGGTMTGSINMAGTQIILWSGFAGIEYHNTSGQWEGYVGTESGSGQLRYNSRQGNHTWYSNSTQAMKLNSGGTLDIYRVRAGGNLHDYEASEGVIRMANNQSNHNYIVSNGAGWGSWNQWIRYVAGVNTWRIGTYDEANNSGYSVWRLAGANRGASGEINYIVAGPRGGWGTNDRVVLWNPYARYDGSWYGDGTHYKILDASNYNSYSPTLTGSGASGTWSIRVTGFANQGTARLYSTDSAYNYDAANPYFGYLTYDGSRWLFQVSPGTPAAVRVAYSDSSGSASTASQVSINYNNDSNANYQLLWGSGNSVYGTGNIYVNPSSDTIYATSYRGSSNVGGTGEATYHPAGIYSQGTNWLYGTMYLNVNSINDTADIRTYNSSYHFRARYTSGSDIYHASLNWYGLQLGNNGENYIIGGRTNTGGSLVFYVNNTSDFTSVNGVFAAKMHSTGRTSFGQNSDNGYQVQVYGSLYTSDWLRVGGSQGLYFESYGGGWRMTDSSYIRSYNGKALSMEGASVDYVGSIYMNGGVYIQTNNNRNLLVKSSGAADCGILGRGSGDQFAFQIYGSGGDYGFLNGTWAAWDIRKTANGAMYMNDNNSYYLQTNSLSRLYSGQFDYIGVGQAINTGYRIIINGDYYANGGGNYWAEGRFKQYRGSGTWHDVIDSGNIGSQSVNFANYSDRIQTGNNQWNWSNGAHTATNPNTVTLWDQYGSNGGSGYPTVYGTILDIYGRVAHEHDQLYFSYDGQLLHRNCFYGTNSWSSWRTIITSANISSQSVSYASSAGSVAWGNVSGRPTAVSSFSNDSGYVTSGGEINRTYRGIIQDTRGGQRTPNDYDDYRVSWEFTNQIVSGWHSVMTLQGWHDGYAAWQIIGPSDSAHENWYLRSGNNTSWNSLRSIIHSGNFTSYVNAPNAVGNGSGYYNVQNWLQVNGSHGIFWPSYYSFHIRPNISSTYTQMEIIGSKNSYGGIYDSYSAVNGFMYDSGGNGGVYREANGRWYWYHHIGNNCTGISTSSTSSSYRAYIGGSLYAEGDVVAYSDARKKTDIVTIDNALEKVINLRGVYYTRIDDVARGRQTGVIAQEINEVLPEVVTYAADVDEYGVSYGNIVGVLIEAIKEQQLQIEKLQNKLDNVLSSR